jgi:Domain of unknown function (DUF5063)
LNSQSTLIEQFAEAAADFCRWAEASPQASDVEAIAASRLLARLTQLALELPNRSGSEDAPIISHEDWKVVYQRFEALPFIYYEACFTPYELTFEPAGMGDLADDLADIWRDLKEGLTLYHAGHIDSGIWKWHFGFWIHWGKHATSASYALHCWLANHGVHVQ